MDNNLAKSQGKFNALKHGLLAKQVILKPEDSRPFNKLFKRLMEELNPESALEVLLAEQVIVQYWRLRRFLKLENEMLLFSGEPTYTGDNRNFAHHFNDFVRRNTVFDQLSRYSASVFKSFYRALHEYKNLKMSKNPSNTIESLPNV